MNARAAKLGRLFVPFEGKGIPLSVRVARHTATIKKLIRTFSEIASDRAIELDGIPSYDENGEARHRQLPVKNADACGHLPPQCQRA